VGKADLESEAVAGVAVLGLTSKESNDSDAYDAAGESFLRTRIREFAEKMGGQRPRHLHHGGPQQHGGHASKEFQN
jgi:hypothetical protein